MKCRLDGSCSRLTLWPERQVMCSEIEDARFDGLRRSMTVSTYAQFLHYMTFKHRGQLVHANITPTKQFVAVNCQQMIVPDRIILPSTLASTEMLACSACRAPRTSLLGGQQPAILPLQSAVPHRASTLRKSASPDSRHVPFHEPKPA